MTLPCTIPFPCDSYGEALYLKKQLENSDVLHATRGDGLSLRFEDDQWYVVVSTGNIRGMLYDLTELNFM